MAKIQVLLVDDHTIVRQGLRVLLELEPDITVVGEAESGRQAVRMAKELLPDVVVMDIAMPSLNGWEATRQICKEVPTARVLVLSSYSDDEYLHRVTEAGATGYLLKHTAAWELAKAVREIRKGNPAFSPAISKRIIDRYCEAAPGGTVKTRADLLTSRESEVLQLIGEGKANKQIADELCISIKTVEKHRQQLMNKLNIHEVAGLTRYAIARGMVETTVPLPTARSEQIHF